jgi:hypothetical protein
MRPRERSSPQKLADYLDVLTRTVFQSGIDLVQRFKFLGATGAYYFLHVVGEPVPPSS